MKFASGAPRLNTLNALASEAVLKESGDVILSKVPIYAEVGEIFAGTKHRPAPETTVFNSVGLAVEDIAAAKRRRRRDVGRCRARHVKRLRDDWMSAVQ